jgi:hypothetical protein
MTGGRRRSLRARRVPAPEPLSASGRNPAMMCMFKRTQAAESLLARPLTSISRNDEKETIPLTPGAAKRKPAREEATSILSPSPHLRTSTSAH